MFFQKNKLFIKKLGNVLVKFSGGVYFIILKLKEKGWDLTQDKLNCIVFVYLSLIFFYIYSKILYIYCNCHFNPPIHYNTGPFFPWEDYIKKILLILKKKEFSKFNIVYKKSNNLEKLIFRGLCEKNHKEAKTNFGCGFKMTITIY